MHAQTVQTFRLIRSFHVDKLLMALVRAKHLPVSGTTRQMLRPYTKIARLNVHHAGKSKLYTRAGESQNCSLVCLVRQVAGESNSRQQKTRNVPADELDRTRFPSAWQFTPKVKCLYELYHLAGVAYTGIIARAVFGERGAYEILFSAAWRSGLG